MGRLLRNHLPSLSRPGLYFGAFYLGLLKQVPNNRLKLATIYMCHGHICLESLYNVYEISSANPPMDHRPDNYQYRDHRECHFGQNRK